DQVVAEASALKLSENRIYITMSAGELLWGRDEPRARLLFSQAAQNINELMQRTASADRQPFGGNRNGTQLRQQLVLTVARHDAAFAYQMLQSMPVPQAQTTAGQNPRGADQEANLEKNLVAMIAANDPKAALKSAQEWLDKGEYPAAISKMLGQLQQKDTESAAKLGDRLVQKLQPEDLLAKQDAARLSLSLLGPGPLPEKPNAGSPRAPTNSGPVLSQANYRDLLGSVITAGLRATPSATNAAARGRGGRAANPGGAPANATLADQPNPQANAWSLLMGLQALLPNVDKYQPDRSNAVRQKLAELSGGNNPRNSFGQLNTLMQQGTSDSLLTAASLAPPRMQDRIYQQAAMKAIDEGNSDRAREIANKHLDSTARDTVLRAVDVKKTGGSEGPNKMDEIRQTLAGVQSDDERVSLLVRFAESVKTENPKLAVQLLDDARSLVTRKATSYRQLDAQANVAHAFAALDVSKSFEVLEPGIAQINELLSAAALLNGFEVNMFRDGELPLQNGGSLVGAVNRVGKELAFLATIDFERAQALSDRFQLSEPRVLAKLAIVMGLLGGTPVESANNGFGGRGFNQPGRPN
ncbi:MAG TPA: hypothetical protein VFB82_03510, partial [Blastocatellia bacterium]|nr:hypothetical protein [Blastocatellia bacterium]